MSSANNKLADYYARYSNHSFLVVDDFAEFRLAVKAMLEEFGATHVDLASNGEEAYQLYKQQRHDIVLSDFRLGEGKDGQQLLEELLNHGLLRHDTLYLLVSAENSLSMVMGALENAPDDYLTKPFTKASLRTRLDRLIERKQALIDVYQALNQTDHERAILCCKRHIARQSRQSGVCVRLMADSLCKLGRLDEARQIAERLLQDRPLPWAMLLRARCLYQQRHFEQAAECCHKLLQVNPQVVEGLDLLAKCERQMGTPISAQETLERAVEISPRNVHRLRTLASLAMRNSAVEIELKTRRALHRLLKHSSQHKVEDFMLYINALFHALDTSEGTQKRRLGKEIQSAARETSTLYADSALVKLIMQSASLRGQVLIGARGKAVVPAKRLLAFMPVLIAAGCGPAVRWLQRLADALDWDEYQTQQAADDPGSSSHKDVLEAETAFAWACLEQQQPKAALQSFVRQLKLHPDDGDLRLGALRAQVALAEHGDRLAQKQAIASFTSLMKLSTSDHRLMQLQQLRSRLNKLHQDN